MKKVGIITFHRAKNYGAVLQGYALQKAVQSFENDCEIIDYKCENIDKSYKPFQFNASDPVKSIIKSVIMFRKRSKRIKSFSSFYNNYLRISQESYTDSEIKDCKNKYDIFITGSDQVWGQEKRALIRIQPISLNLPMTIKNSAMQQALASLTSVMKKYLL